MAASLSSFKTITGVQEDTAKDISFAQLKLQAQGTGLTTIQAFKITEGTGTLQYATVDSGVTTWNDISEQNLTHGVWLSKAGVSIGLSPILVSTLTSTGTLNPNLRWIPDDGANNTDTNGVTGGIVGATTGAITAFSAAPATAIGSLITVTDVNTSGSTADEIAVNADVLAINDAPVLPNTVSTFSAAHSGVGYAFGLKELLAHAPVTDVDNAVSAPQVSTITLGGTLHIGDVVNVGGVSTSSLAYTMISASPNTDAALLATAINTASGSTVMATASGNVITLTAKAVGTGFTAATTVTGTSPTTTAIDAPVILNNVVPLTGSTATDHNNITFNINTIADYQVSTITLLALDAGDSITVSGVASGDVIYDSAGDADETAAAADLALAINNAAGAKVTATSNAGVVTLTSNTAGQALVVTTSVNATGGATTTPTSAIADDTITPITNVLKYAVAAGANDGTTTGSVLYGSTWYVAGTEVVLADTELTNSDILIWTPLAGQKDAVVPAFTVTAWDGQLESGVTAGGAVTAVNVNFDVATPVAVADTVTITEDVPATILATTLFNGDTDAGETLRIREVHVGANEAITTVGGVVISTDSVTGGAVWLDANGNVAYKPAANSHTDTNVLDSVTAPTFDYTVETPSYYNVATANLPTSMTNTVTATITAVNDAPTITLGANTSRQIGLATDDTGVTSAVTIVGASAADAITLADIDSTNITVTLSVGMGALTTNLVANSDATADDTVGSAGDSIAANDSAALDTITLTGTKEQVQLALNTLKYLPFQDGTLSDVTDEDLIITVTDNEANTVVPTYQTIRLLVGADDNAPKIVDFLTDKAISSYAHITQPWFIQGVSANDVALTTPSTAIVLTALNPNSTNGQHTLTLTGYTGDLAGNKIEFTDGSTLQYSDLMSTAASPAPEKAVLYGTGNQDHLILAKAAIAGGTLKGYMNIDKLDGSAGRDVLYGGDGNDIITGNSGNDYLNGGTGDDTFVFDEADGADVIADFDKASETDADQILLPSAQAIVISQSGADTLIKISDTGSIRLMSTEASTIDENDFALPAGTDTAKPAISRVIVDGEGGYASLTGGTGDDTITGGEGSDAITGGLGNDVIKYNASNESTIDSVDVITDLVLNAEVADRIDLPTSGAAHAIVKPVQMLETVTEASLNGLLNSATGTGNDGTENPAAQKFSGSGVDVAVVTGGTKTFLAIDLDGNGAFSAASDMLIELVGGDISSNSGITVASFI